MTFEHSEPVLDKATLILEDSVNPAFHISEEIVDKLLDKLSNDNEFRAVFLRSPRIALAYLGHEAAMNASPGDVGVWNCARCEQLADAETIRNTRDALHKQLIASLAIKGVVGLDMAKKAV